jgi:hypothetical protein
MLTQDLTGAEDKKEKPSILSKKLQVSIPRREGVFDATRRFYFDAISPHNTIFSGVNTMSPTASTGFVINHEELSSLFGGPIESTMDKEGVTFISQKRFQSISKSIILD